MRENFSTDFKIRLQDKDNTQLINLEQWLYPGEPQHAFRNSQILSS